MVYHRSQLQKKKHSTTFSTPGSVQVCHIKAENANIEAYIVIITPKGVIL